MSLGLKFIVIYFNVVQRHDHEMFFLYLHYYVAFHAIFIIFYLLYLIVLENICSNEAFILNTKLGIYLYFIFSLPILIYLYDVYKIFTLFLCFLLIYFYYMYNGKYVKKIQYIIDYHSLKCEYIRTYGLVILLYIVYLILNSLISDYNIIISKNLYDNII